MSRRQEQLAATLRAAIQEVIDRGLQDPRVSGLITVTSVRLSEDLRSATAMVSVLPAERQDLTLHGLRGAAGHIRHEISETVAMRQVPEIVFKVDLAPKKQAGVIEAIARAAADLEARAAAKPAEPAAGDEEAST